MNPWDGDRQVRAALKASAAGNDREALAGATCEREETTQRYTMLLAALRDIYEWADRHEDGAPDSGPLALAANRIKGIAGDAIERATGEKP